MWQNFEKYCINKHRIDTNHITYHWENCPEEVLDDAGFIHDYNKHRLNRLLEKKKRDENKNYVREYGLDGISYDGSAYYGLQMKNWAKNRSLTANDLGTFHNVIYSRMRIANPNNGGYLYYSCRLEVNLREDYMNAKIITPVYVDASVLSDIEDAELKKKEENENKKIENESNKKNLWRHQKEAVEELTEAYYDTEMEPLKLLTLPCGCGKTVTAAAFLQEVEPDFIIAIAPLRLTVQQLYNGFAPYLKKYVPILVDMDGTTDPEVIQAKIQKADDMNKKIIIFSTFDSAENVLSKMELSNDFILVDEAHNVSADSKLATYINSFMNGLLLTATPPSIMTEIFNYTEIYNYSISEAIAEKKICDYRVYIPFLEEVELEEYAETNLDKEILEKTAFLFTGMLKTGSRRCIGYFTSKEECQIYASAFKKMAIFHGLNLWTDIITCDVEVKARKKMLMEFSGENFDIYIINSVRILDEAIDIPKCDSEFISSVSDNTSEIRLVQRLMRGCRIDMDNPNKINNLFLWSSMDNKKIFSLLKENDPDFHKKIKTNTLNYGKQKKLKEKIITENIKLDKYVEYTCISIEQAWDLMLERLKNFIDTNKRRPSHYKENEKKLAKWLTNQLRNHKIKPKIKFTEFLTQYREYFKSNTEIWMENLAKVKEYIDTNKKIPSHMSKDPNIKTLGSWLNNQNNNFAKSLHIMQDPDIRQIYTDFKNEYGEYFKSNTEIWMENLAKVKEYIDTNKKTPSEKSKDPNIKTLGIWLSNQNKNFAKTLYNMKDPDIRQIYTNFKNEYGEYFKSNTEIWMEKLTKVKEYIDTNKKTPSQHSKDPNIKTLGHWLNTQNQNFTKTKEIMKDPDIRQLYTDFKNEYGEYFKSNTEIWMENLANVKEYIDTNKKMPSNMSKDPNIKTLGSWLNTQNQNFAKTLHIMKDPDIRQIYTDFKNEYGEYFKSNTEIWIENLAKVKEYIDLNQKTPSHGSKDPKIKFLGKWLSHQNYHFAKNLQIMKDPDINLLYNEFLDEYRDYIKAASRLLKDEI